MTKRRTRGEGGVRQRRDGRWQGAIDLGWQGGKRRRKYVTQRNGETKQDFMAERLTGVLAAVPRVPGIAGAEPRRVPDEPPALGPHPQAAERSLSGPPRRPGRRAGRRTRDLRDQGRRRALPRRCGDRPGEGPLDRPEAERLAPRRVGGSLVVYDDESSPEHPEPRPRLHQPLRATDLRAPLPRQCHATRGP